MNLLHYCIFLILQFVISSNSLTIPREFQNLNIEKYLKNQRAVAFQLKCVVYDGPCDKIGKYLKSAIPEWLATQCRNCDADQKKKAAHLVGFLQDNYPREWNDAIEKFQKTRRVKPEDIKKFEQIFGIKLGPISTEKPIKGAPDLKGLANLAAQFGKEAAVELNKEKEKVTTNGQKGNTEDAKGNSSTEKRKWRSSYF